MKRGMVIALVAVLAVKLILSSYGLMWGAPDRWNQDERINASLKIVAEKTFYYSSVETAHPVVYYYFLFLWLAPYLLVLKLTGFNFEIAAQAASTSWLAMTKAVPGFANGLLMAARSSSVVLGVLTVFLMYLIAKKIFDERTAIFSAAAATFNIGILGTNHFARSENLSLFLIFLSLYLWASILSEGPGLTKNLMPKLYISFFLAGLAMGTKIDSAILLMGVAFMLYGILKRTTSLADRFKVSFLTVFLILSGLLLGYLRLLMPAKEISGLKWNVIQGFLCLFAAPSPEHIRLVFLKVISSYNCAIAIFLFAGLVLCMTRLKHMHKFIRLLFVILAPYYLIIFFFYSFVSTNLFIISFPAMAIFAGYGFKIFWDKMAHFKRTRALLSLLVLCYSVFYAVKADMVYAKNDTRYLCTRWIDKNIPGNATIGIIQEPELLFSSSLVGDHAIYYNGERMSYETNPYIKRKKTPMSDEEMVIRNLSKFDYAVVSSWDYVAFESRTKDSLKDRVSGVKGMELIKSFYSDEDLLVNPRPPYTSPAIFIFKARKG